MLGFVTALTGARMRGLVFCPLGAWVRMGDGERWRGAVLVGISIAVGVLIVVGSMRSDSELLGAREQAPADSDELAEPEPQLFDELGERPWSRNTLSNCASMIGCYDWGEWQWEQWVEEQLAAGKDPFGPHETASACVGFCFNAIIESVDEENRRLARVVMIGKQGRRTPAIVERTSILSSSHIPAAYGEPVRFACFDRFVDEDGLRFESCSQMATLE